MVAVSGFFAILTRTLNRGKIQFLSVPNVGWSLLVLFLVTYVTSEATGGFGARVLGSGQYGGRRYAYLWGAIAAYYVVSAFPLAAKKRSFYCGAYFLSGTTSVVSNLAYTIGPNAYFLFLLFPPEIAAFQAMGEDLQNSITRISGLGPAGVALICFVLMRYGLRGTLDLKRFWRFLLLLGGLTAGLFSGFRSVLVFPLLLFATQFIFERLYKTKYMWVLLVTSSILTGVVCVSANRLPLSIQRCLTIFPLDLDASAIEDARGSNNWRLEMWRALLPDIPKYFWVGKGFAIDPKDLYFAQEGTRMGVNASFEGSIVAGDYHNGPLTLIIPFGIWGMLAFTWFVIASFKVLWANHKYSEPEVQKINTFFLSHFTAKLVFFCFIYGSFYIDILFFTTIVALSISVNRGVRKASHLAPVLVESTSSEPVDVLPGRLQPA
jgi:hypothetical protein